MISRAAGREGGGGGGGGQGGFCNGAQALAGGSRGACGKTCGNNMYLKTTKRWVKDERKERKERGKEEDKNQRERERKGNKLRVWQEVRSFSPTTTKDHTNG